jgi:hypothetical protein
MKERTKECKTFDFMIKRRKKNYDCCSWSHEPICSHYDEVASFKGEYKYKENLFIIVHHSGRTGRGGMDQGSPPSVEIRRIELEKI